MRRRGETKHAEARRAQRNAERDNNVNNKLQNIENRNRIILYVLSLRFSASSAPPRVSFPRASAFSAPPHSAFMTLTLECP